jgi:hypothetical protein
MPSLAISSSHQTALMWKILPDTFYKSQTLQALLKNICGFRPKFADRVAVGISQMKI